MKLLIIGVGVSTFIVFAGVISMWAITYSAELESTGFYIVGYPCHYISI